MKAYIKTLLLVLFFCPLITFAQVSTGTTAHFQDFQVHDSTGTGGMLITSGNVTTAGLHLLRRTNTDAQIFNTNASLLLKGGNLSGTGGEIVLFPSGKVGIGQGLNSGEVTNELTVGGSNPLKLMGLNSSSTLDTLLVKDKFGVVYERPFEDIFNDFSFWEREGDGLASRYDTVGIGTAGPLSPLHVNSSEDLEVTFSTQLHRASIRLLADEFSSVLSSYNNGSSEMLLLGTFPAKGMTYLASKFESVSSNEPQGLLLAVENKKPIYFATDAEVKMRLAANGNLTLGGLASSDDYRLNVEGNTRVKDSIFFDEDTYAIFKKDDTLQYVADKHMSFTADNLGDFSFKNRDSTFVHFDGSKGAVGIGIENPIQKFEVNGDALIHDTLYIGNRFNKIYDRAGLTIRSTSNLILNTRSFYDVEIKSDGVEYATFEAENKRFGVGTNTPEEKVDVAGTVKADLFKMTTAPSDGYVLTSDEDGLASWQEIPNDEDWTKSGSDLYTSSAGSVTIGTGGTPTSLFNVQGSISLPITSTGAAIYTPGAVDHTIILTTPSSSVLLPPATGKEGRIYVLKFLNGGGPSIIQSSAGDSIEGVMTFTVPPSSIGSMYTTIVVQSDGSTGWWIINY